MTRQVDFASREWVGEARSILSELAETDGDAADRFSVCERFTNAPPGMAGLESDCAAWHFRIEGKAVTVAEGPASDVDVIITGEYQQVLPLARMVYGPEGRPGDGPQVTTVEGDMAGAPAYLVKLHNRLAEITR